MTIEDLKKYLRENLEVKVSLDHNYDWYSTDLRAEISLVLEGDTISTTSDTICVESRSHS